MCLLYKVITHKRSLDWKNKFRDRTRWAWKCLWPEKSPWAWEGSRKVKETWFFLYSTYCIFLLPNKTPKTNVTLRRSEQRESKESEPDTCCSHQWLCSYLYSSRNLQIIGQKYPYFSHTELSFLLFEAKKKKCLFRGNTGKGFKKGVFNSIRCFRKRNYNFEMSHDTDINFWSLNHLPSQLTMNLGNP